MDNINRSFRSLLIGAAVKDIARNLADPGADPDNPQILFEKIDDFTFTMFTGFNGDPEQPIPWPTFPIYLTGQGGLIASPTWLAAVDAGTAQPTDAVGTGPFVFQSYAPGDRLIVTKNPDYWRTDENGNQLPYLDEIEFRVIVDSQVRAQALESGDVDMIATSDNNVLVDYLDNPDFPMVLQDQFAETNYWLLHLTIPPLDNRDVRCALQQAIDKADYIDVANSGYGEPANGTVLARPGGLPRRQRRTRVRPRSGGSGDRGVRGRQRPDHHQLLDHADRVEPHTGPVHRRRVGRDRSRHLDQPDRAVDADQQRPVRRSAVRRVRLAQPRRLLRRPAVLLVAQLGGHRRRWPGAELRSPEGPRDRRHAGSGPERGRRRRTSRHRRGHQPALRRSVLHHRVRLHPVGRHPHPGGAEHRTHAAAGWLASRATVRASRARCG